MQDEPQAEAGEEPTAGTEGAGDDDLALSDAVDQQAATSSGEAAESAPEVPDDASSTIARAQEHIDTLDMEQQREAAKKTM